MLILVNGLASLFLQLKLERSLAVASVRMVVQLWFVGLVLKSVFAWERWYAVLALTVLMAVVAGVAAVGRTSHRYAGIYFSSIVSVWASSWLMTAFALLAVLHRQQAWYDTTRNMGARCWA